MLLFFLFLFSFLIVSVFSYHNFHFKPRYLYKPSKKYKPSGTSLLSRIAKLEHLKSPYWKDLKKQRLLLANNQCEACGSKFNLHLHHITYVRLGAEHIDDVRILCSQCHSSLHKITGYDRLTVHHPLLLKLKGN